MVEREDEDPKSLNETIGSILRIFKRRKWTIIIPFFVVMVATMGALIALPNRYTSEAKLLVVQQQVPERYVVPNATTDITSALQAMKQEVLSRTRLLKMINDLGLYAKERNRLHPDELAKLMLSNISIAPLSEAAQKDFDAFRISFTGDRALVAQQVTTTLTSLFINEYLRTGAEQASNTTNFLHEQVEAKRLELEQQEQRLRDFKMKYVGELPEQQAGNLAMFTGLQQQLQNTAANLGRAQQQRVYLQSLINATRRQPVTVQNGVSTLVVGAGDVRAVRPLDIAQNELSRLQAQKTNLVSARGLTREHPEMLRLQREINQAEKTVDRLKATTIPAEPSAADPTPPPSKADAVEEPALAEMRSNLEGNRIEIENLTKEEKRLRAELSQYEGRLNQTPIREQQQSGIIRDTEALRLQYAELLKKEQDSQLATNLEKRQGGQQFRLIDPASLPTAPSGPKRLQLSFAGAAAGLVVSFGLVLLFELRDTSFHTELELTEQLGPPFVMEIPLLISPKEEARHKRVALLQWLAASAMALILLAGEFYIYKLG